MSSSESDVEEDESYQKKMSHSPGPSVVSMKSDQSMGLPMKFSEEQKKSLFKKKRSGSPEISITSVKRKSSDSPYEQADAPRKKYKKTRSDSPGPSVVSMKSEQSMGLPIMFSEEQKRYKKRSDSPGPSVVSLKSDQSMGLPMKFSEEQKKDKRGISDPLPGQLETEFLPTRAEYPAGNIRVMEDKAHLSRTRGPDTSWKQSFKSKLQKKFEMISEGILKYGNSRLLNEVYTELCITSEFRCSHVYEEHEVSFSESCRSLITEESINCNDIFKALPGDERPIRTLLTEGIAGIGKTVSVQKFVLDWTEGKANQDLDFIFPFNFRELHFQKKKCFSLLELLHFYFPETKNQIMDFHHYRIMFIFDGLDESRFTLDFLNSKVLTDPTASASLDVLLTNLINGNLLPSAFLWITSRPAASSEIPPICIHRVTEVRGFSDLQKDEYFRKRISDQDLANKIITHLKSSRSLYIMCHMPVFCWIAATVLEGMFSEAETGEVPKTLTQMFTHFLILQIKRGRLKYKKQEMDPGQVTDIVVKLGKLAFQQLEKGNLIFYEEDLLKCGIDVREATVYSGVCTQIFIEEVSSHLGKVYSFVHLSVQEHLAAVFVFLSCVNGNLSKQEVPEILDLSSTATLLDLLKAAVDKALKSKTGHLDLFLRFLMGLSLESNSVLLQAHLTETGRRYLRNHAAATNKEITTYIKEKIRKNPSEKKSINLFRCLNELDDQSLVQEVQHFLSNRVNHCLQGVKLSAVQWSALVFLLLNSNEVLEEFDLQKYAPSDDCLMKLHQVVAMSRKALLCRCNLTRKSLTSLAKALSSACSCLRELDLSDNNLQDLGFRLLSPGLESPHCKLEILRLHNCQLTQKSCVVIAVVLTSKSTHLIELSLGHNNLQDSGVKSLSGALQSPCCKLKSLSLDECGFTEEGCISLAEALKSNSHLRELDLCANDLGEQGVKMLTDIKEDENYTLEKLKL